MLLELKVRSDMLGQSSRRSRLSNRRFLRNRVISEDLVPVLVLVLMFMFVFVLTLLLPLLLEEEDFCGI